MAVRPTVRTYTLSLQRKFMATKLLEIAGSRFGGLYFCLDSSNFHCTSIHNQLTNTKFIRPVTKTSRPNGHFYCRLLLRRSSKVQFSRNLTLSIRLSLLLLQQKLFVSVFGWYSVFGYFPCPILKVAPFTLFAPSLFFHRLQIGCRAKDQSVFIFLPSTALLPSVRGRKKKLANAYTACVPVEIITHPLGSKERE